MHDSRIWFGSVVLGLSLLTGPARAEDPAQGKLLYEQHCAKCHGAAGDGTGRAGRALDPRPTDFTKAKVDDPFWLRITKLGSKAVGKSNGMEGYGKLLTDEQIRAVLAYSKSFRR